MAEGLELAKKALDNDGQDPIAHFGIGRILMMQGRHDKSIAALYTAIRLNPSFTQAHHGRPMVLTLSDRLDEAIAAGQMCERLSPRDPIIWASQVVQSLTYLLARDYQQALRMAEIGNRNPRFSGYWPQALLAASLAQLGRLDEARVEIGEVLKINPEMTVSVLAATYRTRTPGARGPYLEGLRKAGLPD